MAIAVVGTGDFTLGFRLAGVKHTYQVKEEELEQKVNNLMEERGIGILVLWDRDVKKLSRGLMKRLGESVEPVVIAVGKIEEEDIREKIKKAIGLDLYRERR